LVAHLSARHIFVSGFSFPKNRFLANLARRKDLPHSHQSFSFQVEGRRRRGRIRRSRRLIAPGTIKEEAFAGEKLNRHSDELQS